MFKIESNLKINGRHWGLMFTDGVAHTENAALADKLRLKGYVVTDEAVRAVEKSKAQPEAESVETAKPESTEIKQAVPTETVVTEPATAEKPKPRKKAVKADAADAGGV